METSKKNVAFIIGNHGKTDHGVIVRAQTVDEEFDYLLDILREMSFFKEYGYNVSLPEHPFFLRISNDPELLDLMDVGEAKKIFENEIYDAEYFKSGLVFIAKEMVLVEKALKKIEDWKKWGFKLFPKYEVRLTAYGSGGSYDCDEGSIVITTKRDGSFRRNPIHTVMHEIIHIGIEDCIVKKYELTHTEKEGLVDAICANYFSDILLDYSVQSLDDGKIFKIISENSFNDLPKEIEKYKMGQYS